MILSFKTKFPWGETTMFVEKIWQSFTFPMNSLKKDYEDGYEQKIGKLPDGWNHACMPAKLHTIREDAKNRWQKGVKIHFTVFNRSKNMFRFAPVIECISTQSIEIVYTNASSDYPEVKIDGKVFKIFNKDESKILDQLAVNDGFSDLIQFLRYFNKDFKGKIIHWTDLRY